MKFFQTLALLTALTLASFAISACFSDSTAASGPTQAEFNALVARVAALEAAEQPNTGIAVFATPTGSAKVGTAMMPTQICGGSLGRNPGNVHASLTSVTYCKRPCRGRRRRFCSH